MEAWNNQDSIVAPLVIAYRVPSATSARAGLSAFIGAYRSVPSTLMVIKRQEGRLPVRRPHSRELTHFRWDSGSAVRVVRCIDRGDHESTQDAIGRWVWEARCTLYKPGTFGPAVPHEAHAMQIEVTRFRTHEGAIVGAAHLALLRYLTVEYVRSTDPNAVVFGGQHEWHDSWWTPLDAEVEADDPDETSEPPTLNGGSSPPQWAPDPYGRFELRYFDGHGWTAHVSTGGVAATDAVG